MNKNPASTPARQRATIIAIVSQKGGAGKTTLAIHLAAAAHVAGHVSLIIDCDPQATASLWGSWRDARAPEVIDCAAPPLLAAKTRSAMDLGAQLIVIDTPPHTDAHAAAALDLADIVLVPARPNAFDLAAIASSARLVKSAGKTGHVVFMGYPWNARSVLAEAGDLVAQYGLKAAPHGLPERAAYRHAAESGSHVLETDVTSKAAADVQALWGWVSALAKSS